MAGKRRRRSWGYIAKSRTKDGRVEASYLHIGSDGIQRRYRALTTFSTRLAAEGWLASERVLIDTGTWSPPVDRSKAAERSTVRLAEFAAAAIGRRDLTPKTRSVYLALLDGKIRPHLGERTVTSITADDLQVFWETLDPAHPTARAHAWTLVKSIFAQAETEGVIDESPAGHHRFRRYGARPRRVDGSLLTPSEIAAMTDRLPEAYRVALPILAWCGLRFGELTELRVRDIVDVRGQMVLRIRRSAPLVDGVPTVRNAAKSDAGRRDVTVPPHVAALIRAHLAGRDDHSADSLVVTTTRGARLSQSAFTKSFKAALPPHARDQRVHDLRHAAATFAAQSGATTKELMVRIGHSTPTMALAYQHSAAERQRKIADRLSQMAAGADTADP